MKTVIEAVATMEGWHPGSNNIPTRDNNPGDIIAGKFTAAHGQSGVDGRFAKFATPEEGFAALRALLTAHYAGMTLRDAFNKYAPPIENNTNNYITVVCKLTGLTPDSILTKENIG